MPLDGKLGCSSLLPGRCQASKVALLYHAPLHVGSTSLTLRAWTETFQAPLFLPLSSFFLGFSHIHRKLSRSEPGGADRTTKSISSHITSSPSTSLDTTRLTPDATDSVRSVSAKVRECWLESSGYAQVELSEENLFTLPHKADMIYFLIVSP